MRIYEKRESKLGGDANGNMSDKQGQIDTEQNESKLGRKGIKSESDGGKTKNPERNSPEITFTSAAKNPPGLLHTQQHTLHAHTRTDSPFHPQLSTDSFKSKDFTS